MWDLMKYADNTALITKDSTITYRELAAMEDAIWQQIGRRCLVFLICSNQPAAIASYVSFINHGVVPVMIDGTLDKQLLADLIALYRPEYLWLPSERADEYPAYRNPFSLAGYALLATGEREPYALNEDLSLLMTTSGSTGSPKLVRLKLDNILANTESIVEYLEIDEKERAITNLPLSYVYGLSVVNTHLYTGASLVATDLTLFDRDFWTLFKEKAATSIAGVPYTYEMLKKLRFFKMDLPSLGTMTQAGGKLDPELHREFAEYAAAHGSKFVVMYGAAEATARMGYLPPKDSLRKYGCMGIPIPGGRFDLVAEDGKIIEATDTVGELIYYGRNVSLGYATHGEDLALGDERHGRLETGDLARRDAEGYYTVVGRKKRFLKLFGKRTNLQEVEIILRAEYPGIDVACAGIDDHLYIFTPAKERESEIIPFLSGKLSIHHSAFHLKIIDAIPKNQYGKTAYKDLESYYDV